MRGGVFSFCVTFHVCPSYKMIHFLEKWFWAQVSSLSPNFYEVNSDVVPCSGHEKGNEFPCLFMTFRISRKVWLNGFAGLIQSNCDSAFQYFIWWTSFLLRTERSQAASFAETVHLCSEEFRLLWLMGQPLCGGNHLTNQEQCNYLWKQKLKRTESSKTIIVWTNQKL